MRSRSVAVTLAIAFGVFGLPGAGHVYLGRLRRALGLWAALLGIVLAWLIVAFVFPALLPLPAGRDDDNVVLRIAYFAVLLVSVYGLLVWQVFDVARLAKGSRGPR